MKLLAIGREDELDLVARGLRTVAQRGESGADLADIARREMDVAALEYAFCDIRLIGVALAQPVNRDLLVAERGEKSERKLSPVKGLRRKLADGFFDLNWIHARSF